MNQRRKSMEKLENAFRWMKWKYKIPKLIECSKNIAQEETYSCIYLNQQRKPQIRNLILHLKKLETEKQVKKNYKEGNKTRVGMPGWLSR